MMYNRCVTTRLVTPSLRHACRAAVGGRPHSPVPHATVHWQRRHYVRHPRGRDH